MDFKIVIEQDDDGWYIITVPALPGCISQGKTEEEAKKNIAEAIELHLDEPGSGDWTKDRKKYLDKDPDKILKCITERREKIRAHLFFYKTVTANPHPVIFPILI